MEVQFSTSYDEMLDALTTGGFCEEKAWAPIIRSAKKLVQTDGFDVGEGSVLEKLRELLRKGAGAGSSEASAIMKGAGVPDGVNPVITGALTRRLGTIKTLRHTYLSKQWGGHKEWIVTIPDGYVDWPTAALTGGLSSVVTLLSHNNERLTAEDRKHLKDASQLGLRWAQLAMSVAADAKKSKNFEIIARWFADQSSTDADVLAIAGKLNAGCKKIAGKMKDGHLIYTESVTHRGTDLAQSEAFFWSDRLNVVYIEDDFFSNGNTLTGLTNWARILVHEFTHMLLNTDDHAYEWQGMAPRKIGSAKAITNADSWAWFMANCGGALTDGQIKNALARI